MTNNNLPNNYLCIFPPLSWAQNLFWGQKAIPSSYDNGSSQSLFFSIKIKSSDNKIPIRKSNLISILKSRETISIEKLLNNDTKVLYLAETHTDEKAKVFIKNNIDLLANKGFTHIAFEFLSQDEQGAFMEKAYPLVNEEFEAKQADYDLTNSRRYRLFLGFRERCHTDPKFYGEIADKATEKGMTVVGIGYTKSYFAKKKDSGSHDQMGYKLCDILKKEPNAKIIVLGGLNHFFYDGLNDNATPSQVPSLTVPGIVNYYNKGIKQQNIIFMGHNHCKEGLINKKVSSENFMLKIPYYFKGKNLTKAEKGYDYIIHLSHQQ